MIGEIDDYKLSWRYIVCKFQAGCRRTSLSKSATQIISKERINFCVNYTVQHENRYMCSNPGAR